MTSVGHASAAADTHQKWIPLLEMATREVFEFMLSCQLTPASIMDESSMNVTSMVGLAGQLCGVITVRCHDKTAALMTSKMLGLAVEKVGQDFSDALGEVCNEDRCPRGRRPYIRWVLNNVENLFDYQAEHATVVIQYQHLNRP